MAVERRGPAVRNSSDNTGRQGCRDKSTRRSARPEAGDIRCGEGRIGRVRWSRRQTAAESAAAAVGRISLGVKRTGERSAGKPPAPFDVAGVGDGFTAELVRHSQRKRGATDRPGLRSTAPTLDPTLGG